MTSLREGVNYCLVDFFRKGVGSQPSDQPKVFQPKSFSVMGEGGGRGYPPIPPIFSPQKAGILGYLFVRKIPPKSTWHHSLHFSQNMPNCLSTWHSNFSNANTDCKIINFLLLFDGNMWRGTQTTTTSTLVIRTKSQRAPPHCPVGFRPHENQDGVITTSPKNAISRTINSQWQCANIKLVSLIQSELMGVNGFMGRPETGRPVTGR